MPGRSAKKGPVASVKSITDFFARTTTSSSQPRLSQSISAPANSQIAGPAKANSQSVSSNSHISISSGTRSSTTVSDLSVPATRSRSRVLMAVTSPLALSKASHAPPYRASPITATSKKRSRSPGPRTSPRKKSSTNKSRTPATGRRRTKFDDDPDVETLDTVIYVSHSTLHPALAATVAPVVLGAPPLTPRENDSCQPKSSSRKRRRLSPPQSPPLSELVPSSQSGEEEMIPPWSPPRDPELMKQTVDQWRKLATSPGDPWSKLGDAMEVDEVVLPPFSALSFSPELASEEVVLELKTSGNSTCPATPMAHRVLTPPPTDPPALPALPPTPVALDAAAKAAQIIAQIKAKAYADSMSSPEDGPLPEFKEELDDSSGEEDLFPWNPLAKDERKSSALSAYKVKPKAADSDPFNAPSTSASHSGRYRPRGHTSISSTTPSTSQQRSASPTSIYSRRKRAVPPRGPVILTKDDARTMKGKGAAKKKASPGYDPLDVLLNEKKLADKRGKGDEAFRLAEDTIASKEAMKEEMDSEDGEVDVSEGTIDWTNEDTAKIAVLERHRMGTKSSSPVASGSGSDAVVPDDKTRQRLFGEGRAQAIVNILDSDKEKEQKAKEKEKVLGVPLWRVPGADLGCMETESTIPVLANTVDQPVIQRFKTAVGRGDFAHAALILDCGILNHIDHTTHIGVIPYLCQLALCPTSNALASSAFRSLLHIWSQSGHPVPGMSFSIVLSTLVRLGAELSVLIGMGWSTGSGVRPETADTFQRDDVLNRLVVLLTLTARSHRLISEEAPDLVVALILIAIDISSSDDLQRDISVAIDSICQSLGPGNNVLKTLESAICTKVLGYTSSLKPINKAFVVSFLSAGSARTSRIARWVAHSIIMENQVVLAEKYTDLPPLLSLLLQLVPDRDRDPDSDTYIPRKFELHEKTDYVDMGFYVQILGVAISNVEGYVAEDRRASKMLEAPGSPNTSSAEKMGSPLEIVRTRIQILHSSIADTQAAHLDRSRTKAAIQQLSMRIHYQHMSASRGSTGEGIGKPRKNLHQYFLPKS